MAIAKYTKEDFYNEIKRLYNKHGRIDQNIYEEHTVLKVSFRQYCNKYGGLKNICKELGIDYSYYNQKSKQEIIDIGIKLLNQYGELGKDICIKNGISSCVVKRLFGNFQNFYKELGYDNNFHRNTSPEDVENDIKEFVKKYNTTSSTLYRKYGNYSQGVVDRFGGWVKILEDMGLKPVLKKPGRDEIIRQTQELIDKYGFLSVDLIKQNCQFTLQALEFHLGNAEEICKYFNNPNLFDTSRSSMEILIEQLLAEVIGRENFYREYTWEWLLSETGNHLYVDFYIPNINIVIEYDGQQHYEFSKFFYKTEEQFRRRQCLDRLKEELLLEHSIKLIRIPYYQKIDKQLIESICK